MWFRRKDTDELLRQHVATLERRVLQLERQLSEHDENLQSLQAQHVKLRGRVYALWGAEKSSETSTAAPDAGGAPTSSGAPALPESLSRQELRRRLTQTGRFVPGKAPIHD